MIINGQLRGCIVPKRELRQGCPLSSYLFLLCSEALTSLINKAKERKLINGLKLNVRCSFISHLLFADDSLLFFKANKDEAQAIKQLLVDYELLSGQTIGFQKSSLTVSPDTIAAQTQDIMKLF